MTKKPITVLSLFDGMSAAKIALEKAGIPIKTYYASEIDPWAMEVAERNYPNTIQLGDVREIQGKDLPPIDLLIGGSPCQDLSIAGTRRGLRGKQSNLFFEFVRLLKETQPRYFLLENVASMKPASRNRISRELGVEPVLINSSLVSAQSRKRYYWTNLNAPTIPKDQKVYLVDILEKAVGADFRPELKSFGKIEELTGKKGLSAFVPKGANKNWRLDKPQRCAHIGSQGQKGRINGMLGKSPTLQREGPVLVTDYDFYRPLTPIEWERLQTVPDNYTFGVSDSQRFKMLGNGFTVEVVSHLLKQMDFSAPPSASPSQTQTSVPMKRTKPQPVPALSGKAVKVRKPYKLAASFFKFFLSLHGKRAGRKELAVLLDPLQEAFKSGKVRKSHPHAQDLLYIQERVLAVYNDLKPGEKRQLSIAPEVQQEFKELASWAGRIPGEVLLDKFSKAQSKSQRTKLKAFFPVSLKKKRIQGKWLKPFQEAWKLLKKDKKPTQSLAGIEPTLKAKPEEPVGFRTDQLPDNAHLKLPFSGKWRDLFNQPTKGFSAMVYGKPKQGKSTLVLELCGDLVRAALGKVLWVELEEDLRTTFKEKVDRLQVGHPDFRAWHELPNDLTGFDFVVINSVSEGKITPDEIRELKKKYRETSFLLIYHTRKDGEFAGGQEHAHLVDILIEVKNGKAYANGRFGRGETEVSFTPKSNAQVA